MRSTMKRFAGGVVVLSIVALFVGACDDSSSDNWGGPLTPAGSSGGYVCSAYTSCGSCTAISGCGWCEDPSGRGLCAWGPDGCPSSSFFWAWNPSDCRTPADASVTASGDGAVTIDASPGDGALPTDATPDAVARGDGAVTDSASDSAMTDSATVDTDAVATDAVADSAPDVSSSGDGCAVNAGTLCTSAAPFGVTCTTTHPFEASIPTPDPSLGCSALDVPTSVGSAYFCCASAP